VICDQNHPSISGSNLPDRQACNEQRVKVSSSFSADACNCGLTSRPSPGTFGASVNPRDIFYQFLNEACALAADLSQPGPQVVGHCDAVVCGATKTMISFRPEICYVGQEAGSADQFEITKNPGVEVNWHLAWQRLQEPESLRHRCHEWR
jgi:hypothetical protein